MANLGTMSFADIKQHLTETLSPMPKADVQSLAETIGSTSRGSKKDLVDGVVKLAHEHKALDNQNRRPPFSA
jgi:hypothetical protein